MPSLIGLGRLGGDLLRQRRELAALRRQRVELLAGVRVDSSIISDIDLGAHQFAGIVERRVGVGARYIDELQAVVGGALAAVA